MTPEAIDHKRTLERPDTAAHDLLGIVAYVEAKGQAIARRSDFRSAMAELLQTFEQEVEDETLGARLAEAGKSFRDAQPG